MPSDTRSVTLTLQLPHEFADELTSIQESGLRWGTPRSLGNADLLDAPLSGAELRDIIQVVSLIISTTTAAVTLAERVAKFKERLGRRSIAVTDTVTGEVKGRITPTTSEQEIITLFGPE